MDKRSEKRAEALKWWRSLGPSKKLDLITTNFPKKSIGEVLTSSSKIEQMYVKNKT